MNINDGTDSSPRLRVDLNLGTLNDLPSWSAGPTGTEEVIANAIRKAGYGGVQGEGVDHWRSYGLEPSTLVRVNEPGEIPPLVEQWSGAGYGCATLHVGWGYESADEAARLVDAVVAASERHSFPLFVETHRATITQDPWRTVTLVDAHQGLRINADYSHWYSGCELVYGDFEDKLDRLAPVFEKVGYMHARVGNAGHIQRPLNDPTMKTALAHFAEMWTRSMTGFIRGAAPGDVLVFAPELLQPSINYAPLAQGSDGQWDEMSDRWLEAIELGRMARECFERAQSLVAAGRSPGAE